jgi:hypothetical protein
LRLDPHDRNLRLTICAEAVDETPAAKAKTTAMTTLSHARPAGAALIVNLRQSAPDQYVAVGMIKQSYAS